MIVLASDLDNTLIYSYKKLKQDRVLVETLEGKHLSYMTRYAYQCLKHLPEQICFVPVTTRSLEQYRRINLPIQPRYALVANGGILLISGSLDLSWYEDSLSIVKKVEEEMEKARLILEKDPNISREISMVDGLFLFTKSCQPENTIKILTCSLNQKEVNVLNNGEKVYVLPVELGKGCMLKRLAKRLGNPKQVVCGDSLFDVPMLLEGDVSIFPRRIECNGLELHKENEVIEENQVLSDEIFSYLVRTGVMEDRSKLWNS